MGDRLDYVFVERGTGNKHMIAARSKSEAIRKRKALFPGVVFDFGGTVPHDGHGKMIRLNLRGGRRG